MTDNQARVLMVQGTCSSSGKTTLVAALCRIFVEDGLRVAPFKAQNMSLNSYVTKEGLEISRAQALQAMACKIEPAIDMNPILLKPSGNTRSQIVLEGKPLRDVTVNDYYQEFARSLGLEKASASLSRLRTSFDLIVIEGAGSAVEPNLYDQDITNMKIADIADAPVILVSDIDRGGAFASILGTFDILRPNHRERVKGVIINKFRGDRKILEPAIDYVQRKTGKPVLGVVPYFEKDAIRFLPSEDSLSIGGREATPQPGERIDVAVIHFPRISNFTDIESLFVERNISVRYVETVEDLGDPDLIILPGSKNTIDDLRWLHENGLGAQISERYSLQKTPIIGICGGYQMLGNVVDDSHGIEGGNVAPGRYAGLGLLDATTTFSNYEKQTERIKATVLCDSPLLSSARGTTIEGYEIHMGSTKVGGGSSPAFTASRGNDSLFEEEGACSKDGLVLGTSIHGLFDNPVVRASIVQYFSLPGRRCITDKRRGTPIKKNTLASSDLWELGLQELASLVRGCLDMEKIIEIVGLPPKLKT